MDVPKTFRLPDDITVEQATYASAGPQDKTSAAPR
jgi:hypothetical protein